MGGARGYLGEGTVWFRTAPYGTVRYRTGPYGTVRDGKLNEKNEKYKVFAGFVLHTIAKKLILGQNYIHGYVEGSS